jgi:hypothetical protein
MPGLVGSSILAENNPRDEGVAEPPSGFRGDEESTPIRVP